MSQEFLVDDLLRQLKAMKSEVEALQRERDEFERKGKDLCCAYGNSLLQIHDLRKALEKAAYTNGPNRVCSVCGRLPHKGGCIVKTALAATHPSPQEPA